jgi:hypothetical protein
MRMFLLALLFLGLPNAYSTEANINCVSHGDTMVYVCTGKGSYRYHRHSDCSGLNNCKGSIKRVTLQKAQSMKRTPCKKCY